MVRFADSHIVEAAEKVGKIIAKMMSFDHTLYKGGPDAGEGGAPPHRGPKGNFQKKLYDLVQALQKDRDKYLTFYHTERPHQDCRNTERGPTTQSGS